MKLLFIESRKKISKEEERNLTNNIAEIRKLGNIHILYSIQYKKIAELIRKQLGSRVIAFQQVLGCSIIKPKANLLLIGSGRFHALQIAMQTGKEVYVYNNSISKISKEEIKDERKKRNGKLLKFYFSDNIGIIVSVKPGQNNMHQAIKLKKKFKNKNFYFFLADNINIQELENFPCFFINTACPGISLDSDKLINYENALFNRVL